MKTMMRPKKSSQFLPPAWHLSYDTMQLCRTDGRCLHGLSQKEWRETAMGHLPDDVSDRVNMEHFHALAAPGNEVQHLCPRLPDLLLHPDPVRSPFVYLCGAHRVVRAIDADYLQQRAAGRQAVAVELVFHPAIGELRSLWNVYLAVHPAGGEDPLVLDVLGGGNVVDVPEADQHPILGRSDIIAAAISFSYSYHDAREPDLRHSLSCAVIDQEARAALQDVYAAASQALLQAFKGSPKLCRLALAGLQDQSEK